MGSGLLALVLALATGIAACGAGAPSADPSLVRVVATTTVFADLAAQVGGSRVSAASLVPRNGDVHTFEARPADVRAVAGARLLVMNGLGLDDWLEKTISNAAADGTPILRLGEQVPVAERIAGDAAEGEAWNPHLWLAVSYAERYVAAIAEALAGVDPAGAETYRANAAAYTERLRALDAATTARFAAIPEAKRRIVTFHDALPYFARAYGLTVVGVAVTSPGQDPSAAQIAELVAAIRAAGVSAIFSETQFPSRLVDQLAGETGVRVESALYTDALGDPPADSYLGIMAWNVDRIAEALGG